MQQVLHYSALNTGVAYIRLTFAVIIFAGVAQALTTRLGVRWVLRTGMASQPSRSSCTPSFRFTVGTSGTSSRPSC